ncbi:hypothetical protein F5148DRAFT_1162518 [Russula earlei]|uniref:Uncharacterized protein n=1 Tax=Russula earlei TaxID=71964 RepID=A0ACC0UN98_9AGAM|nr:hypothetical protein F5148DRAFT_1162518 [Russula earlei]
MLQTIQHTCVLPLDLNSMIDTREFPVGSKPGWELEQPDSEQEGSLPLKNVADSLLVFHALKQSRSKWLSSTFPKFSSKSRGGKVSDTIPPPHTMRSLGKFDFHIGPHTFPDTSVYEAHYLPSTPAQAPEQPRSGSNPPPPPASSWQMAPPYRATTYTPYFPYGASASPFATAYSPMQRASTPLVSAVSSETPITPALITRVNDAAANDPILANFLQLAASGRATSDQLKTLALLIQSLASAQSSSMPASALSSFSGSDPLAALNLLAAHIPSSTSGSSAAATPPPSWGNNNSYSNKDHPIPAQTATPTGSQPPKDFDLVLEFPERPYDRCLVPRVPVVCERTPSVGNVGAILLIFALPFPTKTEGEAESSSADLPQEVVQFRITKVHQTFWESLLNWAGGATKVEANRRILEKIAIPERVYLQHRLPEGDLLTKLQAAENPYTMKSIKPPHGDRTSTRRRAPPKRARSSTESSQNGASTPKRKRSSQPKASPVSRKIACVSCGQTDVPLMMGGRFCRPCVEAGKTGNEMPASLQDEAVSETSAPQPPSETSAATAVSKRIAGLTMLPLLPRSPLATNPPLVPVEPTDSTSVTPPDPPVVQS